MAENPNNAPFAELPASLVQEVLDRTDEISKTLLETFDNVKNQKSNWRAKLIENGIVQKKSNLSLAPTPTSCGVDGGMAIERLLSVDLVAVGAVAVEGLTPPSEARFWPEPYHTVYVDTETHNADTGSILRGIMAGMELELAQNAPHDIVFLDGSLTTPTIFFNQALSKCAEAPDLKVSNYLKSHIKNYLIAYKTILSSVRSDHYWVAMPKYTTRREIGAEMKWPASYDDRGLLSTVLEAGEYTKPISLEKPKSAWHISTTSVLPDEKAEITLIEKEISHLLDKIRVIYYRPYTWTPALRVEFSQAIADNPARLSSVLAGIELQCGTPAILETYPLYMADRMVKHLAKSIPAFRQITSQSLAEKYDGEISDVFISLHGYRTESGA